MSDPPESSTPAISTFLGRALVCLIVLDLYLIVRHFNQ